MCADGPGVAERCRSTLRVFLNPCAGKRRFTNGDQLWWERELALREWDVRVTP